MNINFKTKDTMETKPSKQQKTKALNIADVSSSATRTIRTQQGFSQHELTLPEDDAIMYMLILKRNKMWFADVTR